jgi:hypothetical protein
LIDTETGNQISIPSSDEPAGSLSVPAASRNLFYNLGIDTSSAFWSEFLKAGGKYEIGWSKTAGQSWCYYDQSEATSQDPKRLPVRRLPRPLKLTLFNDDSAPPQFSMSLTPSANICYISGQPRFAFELEVTSHEKDPITVNFHKRPFRELHGLEEILNMVDSETGEEVEFHWGIGCWESNEDFPVDDSFEEFLPEVPFKRTYNLSPYDPETSNGGELGCLEPDSTYKVSLDKNLPGAFNDWMKGKKSDLLKGSVEEKKERWNRRRDGPILFIKTDPFIIETRSGTTE